MTTEHADTTEHATSRLRDRVVTLYVAVVTLCAVLAITIVIRREIQHPPEGINWFAFGLFAVLLIIGETRSGNWLRYGEGGEITPGWAFSFALMLLGSPVGSIAVTLLATFLADTSHRKAPVKIVFNMAGIGLSLALGSLVLNAFGVHGPITEGGAIEPLAGVGMLACGVVVFASNSLVVIGVLGLARGVGVITMLREGVLISMGADAALLALAPVFVAAVEFSLLLLPMLGITSFLVFQNAKQALRRAHEANHDSLTSLLNRKAFSNRLEMTLTADEGTPHATLLLIDLDGFKEINDRLGHQTGDALLQAFAERMERIVPTGSVAARLGGDEFAILLPASVSRIGSRTQAHELRSKLSETLTIDGFPLSVDMSIGIAFAPEHATEPADLLSCADIAMYRAKRYRTGVEIYESVGRTSREHGRLGLLGDLSAAIDNDELSIHYQPQVRMSTGRAEVVEALLRWQHPTLGLVPPGEFIALAEHTELIGPLTAVVVERAVHDIVALDRPDISVAINISAKNLQDRHFPAAVLATIARAGMAPERLELEITESAIASEPERTWYAIEYLREAGIRITIDDFGTGYSSFLSLRDLRIDRLKIDRTFIGHVRDGGQNEVIVRSIIALARDLGVEAVGEGIEDQATWNKLQALGADMAQGFFVARPLTIGALRRWLDPATSAVAAARLVS
jgi:diguanylate cyclase (GGDEF)-like protein